MLLEGKTGLVLGVANKRSIAWACAKAAYEAGAKVVMTYQDERLLDRVQPLADQIGGALLLKCDVTNDEHMDRLFEDLAEKVGPIDFMVHALAFAKKEELEGAYYDTTPEGFQMALDISVYSLTALARRALPLMKERGGSIVTMTYLGGERVVPHYNVMGVAKAALENSVRYLAFDLGEHNIRVNAISAGPIRTLAAAGIKGFSKMIDYHISRTPMRRSIEAKEVAGATTFLLSDLSSAVTGEIMHVDAGYHCMGM